VDAADGLAQEALPYRKARNQVVDLEDRWVIALDRILGRLDWLDFPGCHVHLREPQRTILAGHRAKLWYCRQQRAGIGNHTSLRSAGAEVVAIPFEPKIEVSYYAIRPIGAQRIAVLDELIERIRQMMSTAGDLGSYLALRES